MRSRGGLYGFAHEKMMIYDFLLRGMSYLFFQEENFQGLLFIGGFYLIMMITIFFLAFVPDMLFFNTYSA